MSNQISVPFLDLGAQYQSVGEELERAIISTLRNCRYILGPRVAEFEKQIADYLGVPFALGVSSGTDALLLALMALDVKSDDIVLTTPYSFFASSGCIARVGGTPMYVDIDERSFNMSPDALEKWFDQNHTLHEKVKAILPVHLFGQSCDMDSISTVAERFGIPIIEDAAQALGARYQGTKKSGALGTLGTIGCYSFFPSKNLGGIGDGGLVATNNQLLFEKMSLLRTHGAKPKYYHSLIGGNFRLDEIQAAALSVKLPHLNRWAEKRRENARYYDQHFKHPNIITPSFNNGAVDHVFNQYVVCIEDRDGLIAHLQKCQIGCEIYYPVPLHLQQCFSYLSYSSGDFPNAERLAKRALALPIYPELTKVMLDYVIQSVIEYVDSN